MNKKFSTLVAALLVSGAGFAMVSAFNAYPLANSPIANAATANVNATLRSTSYTYSVETKGATADLGEFETRTWYAKGSSAGFTLQTPVGQVGLGASTLGEVTGNQSLVLLNDNYSLPGSEALTFTYDASYHLTTADNRVLVINKTDGTLSVVNADNVNLAEVNYATLFANTTQWTSSVAFSAQDPYTIGSEVKKADEIAENKEAANYTANVASPKLAKGTADKTGFDGLKELNTGDYTSAAIEQVGAISVLKLTTANGTSLYLHVASNGSISFTESNDYNNDGAYSKVALAESTDGYNVTLGEATKKYLIYESEEFKLGSQTEWANSSGNDRGVYIWKAGGDAFETALPAESLPFYLVHVGTKVDNFAAKAGTASIANLSIAAGSIGQGTLSGRDVAAKNLFKASVSGETFTLSNGYEYLSNVEGGTTAVEVADATVGKFKLSPVDGAVMLGEKYLVNNSGVKLDASPTQAQKLYLYKPANSAISTPEMDVTDGTVYALAPATFSVLTLLDASVKVVVATESSVSTPDVPTGDAKELDNATNYYLSTGTNYLTMTSDKALGNATAEPTGNTAGLWTATKIENVGQQTYYSFTNLKYGKKLAFKAVYDNSTWTVSYDKKSNDGYNTFFINKKGQITFNVKKEATETTPALNKTYALTFNDTWGVEEYNAESSSEVEFDKAAETTVDIAEVIDLLNSKYGAGNGFGLLFKDKALSADGVKDMVLEANPFTDADLITAVAGPSNAVTGQTDGLDGKMFLKVAGSYPLSNVALSSVAADERNEKQLEAFRTSTFIAIDTVRYSSLVPDYSDDNNFFKYTTVKGSSMLSKKGYIYDGTTAADHDYFKKGGNFEGITRRIQNAEFSFSQVAGSTMKDPAYFYVSEAYIPAENNGVGLAGHGASTVVNNQYITIKKFDNKYYLGAGATDTRWAFVYVGLNNDVDYLTVNGIVNIISRNYETDGQVYANTDNENIGLVLPKYVSLDKPEGQFLVTGGNNGAAFKFENRESGNSFEASNESTSISLKTVSGKENVYAVVGANDTIQIVSVDKGAITIGYQNYDPTKDLDNKIYNLRLQTNVPGMPKAYVTEKDHDATHAMGLDADSLNAATFKLVKFADAKNDDKLYGDSLFVSYEREYSYVKVKDGVKSYDTKKDKVVAFTYAIYNADNNEYVAYNATGANKFYYCNPDLKYDGTANAAALKFIIKQKANGTYHLLPVTPNFKGASEANPVKLDVSKQTKLYGGFAEEGGKIDQRADIYETTYNDLFEIVEVGAPMYRTVEAAPFDTVRIYKEGMDKVALFAESAKAEIVSGKNFLGMKHSADKDLTKTMFSFFVDTAYVNRDNNYKPQYMLVLDADTVHGKYTCNIPSHGLHDNGRIDTVYGKYLINMKDSAEVWDAAKKHNNPYWWERNVYPRLAFVNAKHVGDSLIILNDNGIQSKNDTINLSDNSDKFGVYAFRIADRESKSFLIETAYNRKADGTFGAAGWIKWLNGVPVVVSDMAQAEVFNFEATSNNPTANESINGASAFSVATIDGAVVVKGAEGKSVVIANVLGQTIASTVITSSEATISVPAGVVVVAVEGEAAVKAIVK